MQIAGARQIPGHHGHHRRAPAHAAARLGGLQTVPRGSGKSARVSCFDQTAHPNVARFEGRQYCRGTSPHIAPCHRGAARSGAGVSSQDWTTPAHRNGPSAGGATEAVLGCAGGGPARFIKSQIRGLFPTNLVVGFEPRRSRFTTDVDSRLAPLCVIPIPQGGVFRSPFDDADE